ncbi:MAG: hypothetical protein GVY26_08595 [Bacteroidetes bacterium]|jgi:uncharacterized membrane protein YkvI|nr:hypothetical protein [Bacteroidota bacterium]
MHYKNAVVWIFVILLLTLALVLLYPSKWLIGLGVMVLPFLLLVQAVVILRAKESSEHTFEDDKWYEDK